MAKGRDPIIFVKVKMENDWAIRRQGVDATGAVV